MKFGEKVTIGATEGRFPAFMMGQFFYSNIFYWPPREALIEPSKITITLSTVGR